MSPPLRILITALELNTRRGVQNVTRDLAHGLRRFGHSVTLYTREDGPVAGDLRQAGFAVELSVDRLQGPFDVIHGQHLVACSPVLAKFPETPAIFVAHDNASWFDAAPILPSIRRYAAVSEALAGRIMQDAGLGRADIALILNGVDTDRFAAGEPPETPPRRALAFAKNEDHMGAIRAACAQRRIEVDFVGAATGVNIEDPARVLPAYDLVFASALSAMEAMSCLRPTIVCDGRGMAGMVDMARYNAWRSQNFGLAVLTAPLSVERTIAEIDRYNADEARQVGARLRLEHGIDAWVSRYVALYQEAIAAPARRPEDAAVMWARHLERWTPRPIEQWGWTHDRQALTNELRRLRTSIEELPTDNRLTFGAEGAAARFVDPVGFEQQQSGAVWTTSRLASLRFRPGPMKSGFALTLEYARYLPAADFELEIAALLNGVEIARWRESGAEGWADGARQLLLPGVLCHPVATWLALHFRQTNGAPAPQAPGFSVRAVTFRADPAADAAR